MNGFTPQIINSSLVTPISVTSASGRSASDANHPSVVSSVGTFNVAGFLNPTTSMILMGGPAAAPPLPAPTPAHPIAEFLYQLTKMLSDDNREVIEWFRGRIQVHDPERLASEVLHKYFRHSNYASFQRQLNYFGFRKIAGKGKMSPCAYENDAATNDLRSLLYIKRKTSRPSSKRSVVNEKRTTVQHCPSAAHAGSSNNTNIADVHVDANKRKVDHAKTDQTPKKQVIQQDQTALTDTTAPSPQRILSSQPQKTSPTVLPSRTQPAAPSRHAPLSECMHFPSENTLALLTGQQNNVVANMPQAASLGNTNISVGMACPATAAMNAAAASDNNTLFDSSPQLSALVGNQSAAPPKNPSAATATTPITQYPSALHLLGSLPSSNTLFPDNANTTKNGPDRFPSLLNFGNSFSRESSKADLISQFAPSSSSSSSCVGVPLSTAQGLSFEPTPIDDMKPGQLTSSSQRGAYKLDKRGNQL